MKKVFPYLMLVIFSMLFSCRKENKESSTTSPVPEAIMSKLRTAGFDTSEGLMKYKDGYLVEYDIFLTLDQINILAAEKDTGKPKVEHYRTNNLVTGLPRAINVYMDPGFDSYMQNAFDAALARYNSQHLSIAFQRVSTSGHADISIFSFYEVGPVLGYSAGFPSGGNPGSPIYLNTYYYNSGSARADATTVIAHEIGHAIGYRHTDYMNRTFSCGSGGNEGDGGVGANPIPYTPGGPEANSWMLACSSNTDRPFTMYDRVALVMTYPGSGYGGDPAPVGSVIALKAYINNKYVRAENAGASPLIANSPHVYEWEMFRVIDAGGGLIALQSLANNKYVSNDMVGANPLIAGVTHILEWEKFRWINNGDGTISLQSYVNNSYVSAQNAGANPLAANVPHILEWEKFYWEVH